MTTPREKALALADEADRQVERYRRFDRQGASDAEVTAAISALDQAEAAVSEAEKLSAEPDAHSPWLHEEPRR